MGKFVSSESLFEELESSKYGKFIPSDSLYEDTWLAREMVATEIKMERTVAIF